MEFEQISQAAAATRDRLLLQLGPKATAQLDAFVEQASLAGSFDSYKVYPAGARTIVEALRTDSGVVGVRQFLRAAIAQRLLQTLASSGLARLPARVRAQQLLQFQRIAADGNDGADWLDLDQDLFQKEFGIVSLRLYVAGCQLIDPRCGIPRSVLVRGTPLQWLRNGAMLMMLGGYRPFFEIHAHKFMLDLFGEEGRDECYRCCAELYAIHPEVRGMIAGSWFYDPALTGISPRLAYLRAVPESGGAYLLFVEAGGDALKNALATSPTRRRLHEQGKYMPKNYLLVWGKARQQAWARSPGASTSVPV